MCPRPQLAPHCPYTTLFRSHVGAEPMRFGALLRALPGISQRMLTRTLRTLERDGLVERREVDEAQPGVEYSLSELGLLLLDRKSTRLNSSHLVISYAVFCLQ